LTTGWDHEKSSLKISLTKITVIRLPKFNNQPNHQIR